MRIEHLRQRLRALGAKPAHADRVLRAWLRGLPLASGRQPAEHSLPATLRDALPELEHELAGLVRVATEHPAADGSTRLLLQLADGQTIEAVLLLRDAVCVSTQVGCAVGCRFCMTGRDGLLRQLSSGEIVAQVVLARRRQTIRKVQFMGMGEPAHNLDNVLEAIELLGTHGEIGHKNLVFSTVGDPRVFERLPQGRVKPALALSLHSVRHAVRARLLPKAPDIAPAELLAEAAAYAQASGYPLQLQWTLIDGLNDSEEEIHELAQLLSGKYAVVNFIPYNSAEGEGFRRPAPARMAALSQILYRHGILAKLRQSAGQEVDGGCGQLRARNAGGGLQTEPRRP